MKPETPEKPAADIKERGGRTYQKPRLQLLGSLRGLTKATGVGITADCSFVLTGSDC